MKNGTNGHPAQKKINGLYRLPHERGSHSGPIAHQLYDSSGSGHRPVSPSRYSARSVVYAVNMPTCVCICGTAVSSD